MSAQPTLFRALDTTIVDNTKMGRVFVYQNQTVRVHGVNSNGDLVAALADVNGRDLRPLDLIIVPGSFRASNPWPKVAARRWA